MIIYLGGSMDPRRRVSPHPRHQDARRFESSVSAKNAMAVAKIPGENIRKSSACTIPALKSHADHKTRQKNRCGDMGGMLAFDMKGGLPAARRFLRPRAAVFLLAASLGGVESLVILPIYSSHYNMTNEELRARGA